MCILSTKKTSIKLPNTLTGILKLLQEKGAKPILVGGCVRDHFLNLQIKDYDIEVFHIENFEILSKYLEQFGKVKLVGKSYGVLKLSVDGDEYDFALPRVEKKIAKGHKGFEVISNSYLSFKEAAIRRDFTINALGYDFTNEEILDPFDGLKDLENKTLRHIDDNSFIEDPLRVYRAVQFASRFEFTLDNKTLELCKKIVSNKDLEELPKERIFEELKKVFLKSSKPSIGFELLKELGVLEYFSELKVLIGCEQEPQYHPEGDVWIHTLMCLDEMAKIKTNDEYKDLVLFLAILCHDFGKPLCTKVIDGKITSHKHESLGIKPTVSFLEKLTNDKKLIADVLPLVKYHLSPFQLYLHNSSDKAVKRLALKVDIEMLCLVCLADCLGRTIEDKCKCHEAISWLKNRASQLEVTNSGPKAIVMGKDLIALGFTPGVLFKEILEYAFDLQLDEDLPKELIIEKIKEKYIKG
ncbi:CCA tRNA nucleotidyltransferase [Arcobacter sp.]|uniref:CCA tRNA nucleotidyltransferase n=1 Tax=unclassified Arcobacter TaxID=2593671 RepID=UPI003B004303